MKIQCSKLLSLIMLGLVVLFTSCGDDDPIIDPGTGSVNVADGLYLAIDGSNPSSSAALTSESVEADGFESQSRTGFNGGFMYLEAGDYTVVQVTSKEIAATIGGTATSVTDEGSSCDFNDYTVITTAVDGPAFNVANSGMYRVTHDAMTNELVMHQIEVVSIIGSATPGGWGEDTQIDGTIAADGATFTASELILRSGEWKIRFNCRWSIARKIDPNGDLSPENGYQLFTNFGGSIDDLALGNDMPNMTITEDGEYTVTLNWSPQDGWSGSAERTGDAPELSFNPNDFNMAVVGDATSGGWGDPFSDRDLLYKFDNDNMTHRWYGVVTFAETGNWKFRANDLWDFNLGGDLAALSAGGPDLATPGAGMYYIVLSTADDGATWSATVTPGGWGLIGEGSPSGSWEVDTAMEPTTAADGVTTYTLTGDFTTSEWKFRAGADWPLNLGGAFSFLELDGGNISLGMPGTYTVTLSFDGSVYTASAELQ